ncbi:MAG: alpha-E domain-containing protein [Kiritimatiellia bacterium]
MAVRVTSRVVEDLYWLGRYAERLEESARFLRILVHRTGGEAMAVGGSELLPLARWMSRRGMLEDDREEAFATSPAVRAEVLRRQVFDPQFTGSILDLLTRVRHLTVGLRDRLSSDTWLILNSLQSDFPAKPTPSWRAGITLHLRRIILDLAAFSGMELENMTRGYAWRFLELGRRLERGALVTSAIQAVTAINPLDDHLLTALLELSDSGITYRRRYFTSPELPSTLDLLLREEANPRSIAFQVSSIAAHLGDLPGLPAGSLERQVSDDLLRRIRETPWVAAGGSARHGGPGALLQSLEGLGLSLAQLSDLLTTRYFSHAVARSS